MSMPRRDRVANVAIPTGVRRDSHHERASRSASLAVQSRLLLVAAHGPAVVAHGAYAARDAGLREVVPRNRVRDTIDSEDDEPPVGTRACERRPESRASSRGPDRDDMLPPHAPTDSASRQHNRLSSSHAFKQTRSPFTCPSTASALRFSGELRVTASSGIADRPWFIERRVYGKERPVRRPRRAAPCSACA
jgi:hypothetical protein